MTKDVSILILGLLVAATPYLGFPANYERFIFVGAGLCIAVLAFLIRGDVSFFSIEQKKDTYSESVPVAGDGVKTGETGTAYEQHEAGHK